MKTYAIRGARTKTTGHYRIPGTRNTYCGKPIGAPNDVFATVKGWKLCTRCIKAEAKDRAEAEAVANQHRADDDAPGMAPVTPEFDTALADLTTPEPPAMHCILHGTACDGDIYTAHIMRPTTPPTVAEQATPRPMSGPDRAAADTEARHAAALVTEAEATEGTWRGQWIGDHPDDALFTLDGPEQGALFA